jgi:serine/threonine-protein kinase
MSAPEPTVAPGQVLAGKYRVERVLGKGGMGMVVAALHLQLDKRVALKFLLPEVAQNPEIIARFAREARAAGKIESEHVAKVLDVGTLEDGMPYMVMEYLEGQDLSQHVKQRGALPGQDAIEYVLQACEALAEAHKAGIVHRDLKPANLFLTHRADGSPCVKVLDFGISKVALADAQGQAMTQTSALMGSPNYMAPEQLRSARNVDARTDIWSLGIILQELITGDVAFKADTVPELYVSILQSPPIPLRSRRPDAPPQMEAIVTRCLEKDPARRFANVGELATALGELAPARARLSVERITRIVGGGAPGFSSSGAGMHGTAPMPAGVPAYAPSSQPPSYAQQTAQAQSHAQAPPPQQPQSISYPQHPSPVGYGGQSQVAPQGYGQAAPAYPYGALAAPAYAAGQPQRQATSPAAVALAIVVGAVVLGGAGCLACVVCAGASTPDQPRRRGDLMLPGPRENGAALADVAGAFQRPAGWTTVAPGERSLPHPPPGAGSAREEVASVTVSMGRSFGARRDERKRGGDII